MFLDLKFFDFNRKKGLDVRYNYEFLAQMKEREYPKYLKKFFKYQTGRNLNLWNPKTLSEKIQWLKLHDTTPLKTELTDKILARDWVREKIGDEYLKPVLQICRDYSEIDFDSLPNSFIIKTNHGCKWNYVIRDKEKFLAVPRLQSAVEDRIGAWLDSNFAFFAGFELQYKDISPMLLIEELLVTEENEVPVDIEIYCFNGEPKIFQRIKYGKVREVNIYDENFQPIDLKFKDNYVLFPQEADENIKLAVELARKLCQEFKLVRVDFMEYGNKIFFNEMTFTPFSGYFEFNDKAWDLELGNMLKLKK